MTSLQRTSPPRGEGPLLISIVGPTAAGKTSLAIAMAQALDTEIISADSRQFYRDIPIGTAQPTAEERAMVPHHFVDFIGLEQPYNAGRFAQDAVPWLEAFFARRMDEGRSPVAVVVGGSGLYIQALQDGLDDMPPADAQIRKALNDLHAASGLAPLLAELEEKDPVHFATVDRSNPHRVIRALEVCRSSGETYSSFRKKQEERRTLNPGGWTRNSDRPWDTLTVGLGGPRTFLHDRINARALSMLEAGWLEEARRVKHLREVNALRTVGYPALFDVLDNKMDMDTAVRRIQETTRQFARRQLTWFHRQPGVCWVDARQPERGLDLVQAFMRHGQV